ncbi:MAG: hypothetical protein ACR652_20320 [Methylocystis sp.]|uniref:hypothetical protein n=1 Tax=Methylocystis sp. TaxID=1911079 RepID=UPI003DA2E923
MRSQIEQMLGDRAGEKEIAAARAQIGATLPSQVPIALEWIGKQQQERSHADRERMLSRSPLSSAQKAADVNDAQRLESVGKQGVEGHQLAQMASAMQVEPADLVQKSTQPAPPTAPFFEAGLETIDLPESEPPAAPPPTSELADSDDGPPSDLPPTPDGALFTTNLNQTAAMWNGAAAPLPPGPPPTDVLPPPDDPPPLPTNPPARQLNPPAPSDPPPPPPDALHAPPHSALQNAGLQAHPAAPPLHNPPPPLGNPPPPIPAGVAPAQTAAPGPGQTAAPAPQWKVTEPRAQDYQPRANRAAAGVRAQAAPALTAQQRQNMQFAPRMTPPPGMEARAYYKSRGIVIGAHSPPRRGGLPGAAAGAAPPVANSAPAPAPAQMADPAREQQRLYAQAIAEDMTNFALTQFNLGLNDALSPSALEDDQMKTEISDEIRLLQGEVRTEIEQLLMSRTPDQSSASEQAAMTLARELVDKRLASWRVKDSAASEAESIVTAATFGFEKRLRDSAVLKDTNSEMIKTLTDSFEVQLRKSVDEFLATSAVGINERSLDRAREKANREVDERLAPLLRSDAAQAAPRPQVT